MNKKQLLVITWNGRLEDVVKGLRRWNIEKSDEIQIKPLDLFNEIKSFIHIEKKTIIKTFITEHNNEDKIKYESFVHTKFLLQSSFPQLVVEEPPRTIKSLLMILSELSDFHVTIAPFKIDLKKFVSISEDGLESFVLQYVYCNTLFKSNSVKSKFTLEGDNVVKFLDEYKDSKIIKIKFSCIDRFRTIKFELNEKGLLLHNTLEKDSELLEKIYSYIHLCL